MTPREKDKPHNWWTATTEADSPEPPVLSVQDEPGTEVREVAPPTPGAFVAKDPEHPYMPTPKRSRVTKTTPSSHGKTAGEAEGHPQSTFTEVMELRRARGGAWDTRLGCAGT